jgi:hypothetical protein
MNAHTSTAELSFDPKGLPTDLWIGGKWKKSSDNARFDVIDPATELVLFETPPMFRDHHTGGDTKFGKDGNLYVSVGDGGCDYAGGGCGPAAATPRGGR